MNNIKELSSVILRNVHTVRAPVNALRPDQFLSTNAYIPQSSQDLNRKPKQLCKLQNLLEAVGPRQGPVWKVLDTESRQVLGEGWPRLNPSSAEESLRHSAKAWS